MRSERHLKCAAPGVGGSIVGWREQAVGGDVSEDFMTVAAGRAHSLGLKADISIVARGSSGHGQSNVPPLNQDFVTVASGWHWDV